MLECLAQMAVEGGAYAVGGGAITLAGGVLLRQWQRDRKNDDRMNKVMDDKEKYARDLVSMVVEMGKQNQALVVNNTKAMVELTNALKDRRCLADDPRADMTKA